MYMSFNVYYYILYQEKLGGMQKGRSNLQIEHFC